MPTLTTITDNLVADIEAALFKARLACQQAGVDDIPHHNWRDASNAADQLVSDLFFEARQAEAERLDQEEMLADLTAAETERYWRARREYEPAEEPA